MRRDGDDTGTDGTGKGALQDGETAPGGRWVLRLWPTRYEVRKGEGGTQPIYVGSLIHERILRPLNELSAPRADRDLPEAKDNPLPGLPGTTLRSRRSGSGVVLGGLDR